MKLFRRKKVEDRADDTGMIAGEEALIRALIGSTTLTKEMALEIPTVASCINRIADTISSLPIKLYRKKEDGEVEEIKRDDRLFLLNHDTRDKLTSTQFWRAIVQDYFLGKGAYAYIEKRGTRFVALHYVDEEYIAVTESVDPIFKENQFRIQGQEYRDFELLKVLRKTKNGADGKSIIKEHQLPLSVGYFTYQFEDIMLKKGGGRKGFLTSENKLSTDAINELKAAFKNLYSNNNEEKVVVLNKGLSFQEASNSAVEMQLNENKETNTTQLSMLFNVPDPILTGKATKEEKSAYIQYGVMPVINEIESSLDRDLLTEKEKDKEFYFAFDTRELTRGSTKERYDAYAIGLEKNFLQIDEVRKMEDMPDLGFNWVTLGLQNVLLNPKTMEVYTPNTGQWQKLEEGSLKGGENKNES